MEDSFSSSKPLPEFSLWKKLMDRKKLTSIGIEITPRCNLNCRHCYINVPAGDSRALQAELPLEKIKPFIDDAASLGAVWCLITGGEPLLRKDIFDIYRYIKSKGMLVSVFTNACTITEEHVKFFKKHPPREIEVSVYGITEETYERVTRRKGSFKRFMNGVMLLLENGIEVRLKAMAMRSNVHELPEIARFCREHTKDYFRFDPLLNLRYDRDEKRNLEIKAERLSSQEIVALEQNDKERFGLMQKSCDALIVEEGTAQDGTLLFRCRSGIGSVTINYDGIMRLCPPLWHKNCMYDLNKGSLIDAWTRFVPQVRSMRSNKRHFLDNCSKCGIVNLCIWCPAHGYLETGQLDQGTEYFCKVAKARAAGLKSSNDAESD